MTELRLHKAIGVSGRRLSTTVAFLACVLAMPAAEAQIDASVAPEEIGEQDVARRYGVEFIVFVYNESSGSEVFLPEMPDPGSVDSLAPSDDAGGQPGDAAVPEFGDFLDTAQPEDGVLEGELEEVVSGDSVGLKVMLPEERSMEAVWKKLDTLDAYRPVLWSGWTQAVRDESATPDLPLRRLGAAPLELDGTLKLYLSRYLHLVVDLELEDRVATAAATNPYGETAIGDRLRYGRIPDPYAAPTVRYRIDEDRIVRSDELRYFDHPKFGVIARITRIDEPAADATGALQGGTPRTPARRPD